MKAFVKNTWESEFFKKDIYNVDLTSVHNKTTWPKNSLLYSKIKSEDYFRLNIASKLNFIFCEGTLSFSKKIKTIDKEKISSENIAKESSLTQLKLISNEIYKNSRFREPWFTVRERNSFYQKWIENAVFSLFDDICLILKERNEIIGFLTLKTKDKRTVIGLIGVASNSQGKGIGSKLLSLAHDYCSSIASEELVVSTQLSNIHAANLYMKNNFSLIDTSLWFYKKV